MKIKTTRFGALEINDIDTITIWDGVLGFPESTQYVLLEHDSEGTPFKWLQAIDNPNLAFIVMDPNLIVDDYEIELDPEQTREIGELDDPDQIAMMAIVNIPHENPIEMTVNVRAPIIVRLDKRAGRQVILANEEYPIRHRIFPDTE